MTEKPLIIISSRTGNTLAVGHAVCDALPGAVMMRPSEVPDDLTPYNPVLLGFWCDRGDAPEEILRIAPRLRNKTIGCFATMGGDPEGEKSKAWMQKTSEKLVAMGEGNTLAETFLCRGRIDPEVFQRMTDMLGGTVSPEREAGRRLSETPTGSTSTGPRRSSAASSAAAGRSVRKTRSNVIEGNRKGCASTARPFAHFACALPRRAIMRTSRKASPAPRATTGDNTDEDPSHQRQSARRQHRPRA